MSIVSLKQHPLFIAGRRAFLSRSGLVLSGTAIALLAGNQTLAATMKKTGADARGDDVKILLGALAAEQQANRRLSGRCGKRSAAKTGARSGRAIPGAS